MAINAEQKSRLKALQKRVDAGETLAGEEARTFQNLQNVRDGKPTISKADFDKQTQNNPVNADPSSDGNPSQVGQDPKNPPQTKTPLLLDKDGKISGVAQAGSVDVKPAILADEVKLGAVTNADAATIDPSQTIANLTQDTGLSGQARTGQTGLAGLLEAQARGTAPSLAGLQLKEALDANQRSNLSLARSSDYINPAVGMRVAIAANAQANQATAMQAAQARIMETTAGQAQLAQLLNAQRGQDINIEQNDLGTALAINKANQDAINARAIQQAGLTQEANLTNAGAANASTLAQGTLTAGNNQFNAGTQNEQLRFAAQLLANNNQFNAGQVNQQTGQQAGLNTSTANTRLQTDASKSNATTAAEGQITSAGIYADASKYAADNSLQAANTGYLLENDAQAPGGAV